MKMYEFVSVSVLPVPVRVSRLFPSLVRLFSRERRCLEREIRSRRTRRTRPTFVRLSRPDPDRRRRNCC